ncbi:glycosyltransferase family 2 protein [Patescibacteria group bacterium]|nr:glycosyltransferase family 2 protein [Patescibacteria group bacterium]
MLSIIIPTLNEEEGIAKVICSIPEKYKKESEIIVVDASNDYTPIIAEKLGVKVIKEKTRGKGLQMRKGVEASHGDVLIFLDGDGTDPPQYIPKLLKKLKIANLVLGCRSMKSFEADDHRMRNIFKFYGVFMRPIFGLMDFRTSDPLAGFRAIRRRDWDKLNLKSKGFEIETEMNIRALQENFIIKEVYIPNLKRCGGLKKSKFLNDRKSWLKISKIILDYLKEKNSKSKIKKFKKIKSDFGTKLK